MIKSPAYLSELRPIPDFVFVFFSQFFRLVDLRKVAIQLVVVNLIVKPDYYDKLIT